MKSTLIFLVKFGAVLSEIVLVPRNTAVMAGQEMNMNCVTINHSEVRKWTVYTSNRTTSTIYRHGSSGGFQEHFTHFVVEINVNGPIVISANSTRSSDAGIYTCHCEIDGKDAEYSAHLIVMESLPVCESNLTRNNSYSLIDGDHIWIQCTIKFRGFWAPSMEWIQHGGDLGPERKSIADGIEIIHSPSQSVTSKLTITVNSSTNGSYYSCKIYFANYSDTEVTTADNVPNFTYNWNSSVIYASHSSTQSFGAATDAGTSSAVTSSTTEKSSSVDWYFVSLSSFAALSIVFILIVAVTIARCTHFKKKVSDHKASANKETIEMPTQESAYDIIPYATSDNYETIGEEETDPCVVLSSRPRLGLLPTPGYSGLMPVQPSAPAIYSRMESYETPVDIVPDSTITKVIVDIEVVPEKQIDEFESGKTESPSKESLLNASTYLEVKE